jgi:hypothetical protein
MESNKAALFVNVAYLVNLWKIGVLTKSTIPTKFTMPLTAAHHSASNARRTALKKNLASPQLWLFISEVRLQNAPALQKVAAAGYQHRG